MSFVRLTFILLFWNACSSNALSADFLGSDKLNQVVKDSLDILNANENKVVIYKNAVVTSANKDHENIKLELDVETECIDPVHCFNLNQKCYAYLLPDPTLTLQDVQCVFLPTRIDLDLKSFLNEPPPVEGDVIVEKVEPNNDQLSSGSEDPILPEKNLCCGFPEDVDTNIEGLDLLVDTALRQVEASKDQRHALVKILRVQRQVVAGIKYTLTLEIAPTTCKSGEDLSSTCPLDQSGSSIICEVSFVEQPWITKDKRLIGNNCTNFNDASVPSNPQEKGDNDDGPVNKPKKSNDVSGDLLAEIESQIITDESIDDSKSPVPDLKPSQPEPKPSQPELKPSQNIPNNEDDDLRKAIEELIIPDRPQGKINSAPEVVPNVNNQDVVVEEQITPLKVEQPKTELNLLPMYAPHQNNWVPVDEPLSVRQTNTDLNTQAVDAEIVPNIPSIPENPVNLNYGSIFDPPYAPNSGLNRQTFNTENVDYMPITPNIPAHPNYGLLFDPSSAWVPNPIYVRRVNEPSTVYYRDNQPYTSPVIDLYAGGYQRQNEISDVADLIYKNKNRNLEMEYSNVEDFENHITQRHGNPHGKFLEEAHPFDPSFSRDESQSNVAASITTKDKGHHKNKRTIIRSKRALRKFEKITIQEKPLIHDLAGFVAMFLDGKDEDNYRNVVLNTFGAKKLKLKGFYYNFIVRLGISRCPEDKYATLEECKEKLFVNLTKICKVQVHVDVEYSNPKIVKSQCQNIKKDEFDKNRTNFSRYRRNAPGDKIELNNATEALLYLTSSLKLWDKESGHPNKLKIKEVISVTSHPISGTLWKIRAEVMVSNCLKTDSKESHECGELPGSETRICTFKVWDRPWLPHGKETDIKCDNELTTHKFRSKRGVFENLNDVKNSRTKRGIPGGVDEKAINDLVALEYLKSSLNHLDSDSGHSNKLKVKKVISVTSQVVAGSKLVIKAEVITSDCEKSSDKNADECGELQGAQSKVCEFEIWDRPWWNKQETSVRCENEAEKKYRSKRSTTENFPAFGAPTTESVDNKQALEHVKNSLNLLDSDSGHPNKLKVRKIISVSSQVVAGWKWVIKAEIITSDCEKSSNKNADICGELQGAQSKVCEFEIWEQPSKKQETSVRCENEAEKKYRSKRSTNEDIPAIGAPTTESVDNKQALEHVKNSLNLLDSDSGHPNKLKVKKIISVSSQVVAGWKWVIKAEIITSDCEKSSNKNADICGELQGAQSKVCEFEIWEQPSKKQETSVRCENEAEKKYRSKRSTNEDIPAIGAPTTESVDNKQALEHVKNSLNLLDSDSGHPNKLKVKKIISVSSQVVSGWKWVIKAEIITSDCEKSSNKNADICGELQGAQSKVCEFEIWEQPSKKQETSVRCENEAEKKYRSKRSTNEDIPAIGAPTTESVDNKQALEHVKNSLNLLDSDSGHPNKLKVKKIISVSSQVVAGWKWVIKAEIITSDCEKSSNKNADICGELQGAQSKVCEFEIWDRPWWNKQETSVRCENEAEKKYRSKRSTTENFPAFGAPTTESVDNKQALEHVKNSLNLLDSDSGHPNKLKVRKIISVSSQVVAGWKWVIKAEIITSDCEKSSNKNADICGELQGAQSKVCEFEIWEQPSKKQETSVRCENEAEKKYRSKRSTNEDIPAIGAPTTESVDNKQALEHVKNSLNLLDSDSGHPNKLKVKKIISVSSQVVAGWKWVIKAEIITSDCEKSSNKNADICGELQGAQSKVCEFEIWEQPSKKQETSVRCENEAEKKYRSKRSTNEDIPAIGAPTTESVDNKQALEHVKNSLNLLDSDSGHPNKLKVKKIISVSSQVVSGWKWVIKAEIITSDCEKSSNKNADICGELQGAQSKVCEFEIWEQPSKKQETSVRCENEAEKKYRSKRSTNEDIPAIGAPTTESVDNKQALEHVKNSLNLLDSDSGHPNKLKVKKIISVSSQVVAGWKWVIKAEIITSDCEKSSNKNADICGELQGAQSKVCEFEIWEQPSKKQETSVRCENEAEKKYRSKRSTNEDIPALGAPTTESVDNKQALEHVKNSLNLLDSDSGHPNKLKVKKIISVSSQVVSGWKWVIKAEIITSDCEKSSDKNADICGELQGAQSKVCEFEIWEQASSKKKETSVRCENEAEKKYRSKRSTNEDILAIENLNDVKNSRTKRGLPGGASEQPTNDLRALEYLKSSLNHLDSDSGHSNKLKVKKVISVTSQVVAGSKWVIKAEVITSDCEKSSDKNADECGELQGAQSKVCEFEIWDRPWLNKQETSVRCENEAEKKYRSKRSTTENFPAFGAPTTESVDNKQALEHVKNSLNLLDSDSGHPNKLKVKKIISVSSQVVAGWKWVIKAEIITSDCEKSSNKNADICGELQGAQSKVCEFEIWEQPSKKQETSVRCENEAEKKYRSKRSTNVDIPALGAPTTESVDNKQALEHVKNSLNLLDSDSGHTNKLKVKKIISVSSQVVSGWKWVIKAEIITSDCEKSSDKNADICGELQGAQSKVCEFEIWEQASSKKKETSVRCENEAEKKYRSKRSTNEDILAIENLNDVKNSRTKRGLPGGASEQPTNDLRALEYLKSSLNHLDSDSGHSNKLKVKKVISVTSQVVAGSKWVIKAEVITSDCEKSSDKNADECGELQGAQSKVCEFEIWDRPWLNKQETSVRCENEAEKKYRSKRSTTENFPAFGAPTTESVDNKQALEHVKNSLNLLDSDSGHTNKLKVKKIISVSSQVVSGWKWVIKAEIITSDCEKSSDKNADICGELQGAQSKVCEFEIWEQASSKKKETSVRCENEAEKKYRSKRSTNEDILAIENLNDVKNSRTKRGLPGGASEQPTNDLRALEYLKSSLNHLDSDSGHSNKLKVKKVISVTSQVVAGSKWVIKAEVITSDCEKSSDKNADECGELQGAQSKVCEFEIWDRPWLNKQETSVRCENEAEKKYRSKRSTTENFPAFGAPTTESVDNKQALEHVKNSLNLLDSDSGHPNKLKVKKIISVSSQVVAGWKWVIKAEIITSDCEKSSNKNADICGELQGAQSKVCEFEIWEQPSKKQETSVRCENEAEKKYRSKRSTNEDIPALGAPTTESVDNKQALEHVKNSLNLLDSDSGHPNKLKIKKIISVSSQVVAGSKWVIKAEIITSDCEKSSDKNADICGELQGAQSKVCEFEIWDRPWLNKQETSVRCENEAEKKYRSKRSTNEDIPALGAPTTESVDNKQALEHVKNSLNLLDSDSGHPNKLKVKKIISVTSQVVAGQKWIIKAEIIVSDCAKDSGKEASDCGELTGTKSKICEFEIWDRPWLKKKEVSVKCENEETKKYKSKRSIGSGIPQRRLLGAPAVESLDNPKAIRYVLDGLLHLDSTSNNNNKLKIEEILSVTKQIVAGQKWNIKARVAVSDCSVDDSRESQNCGYLQGAESKICTFEILDQPWLPNGKQTDIKCDDNDKLYSYRSKRSLGDKYSLPSSFDGESPNTDVYDFVQLALEYLDSQSSYDTTYALKEILKVSKTKEQGMMWRIKASIGISDCVKGSTSIYCEPTNVDIKICTFKVWEQSSSDTKKLINIKCKGDPEEYTFVSDPKIELNTKSMFQDFMKTHLKRYSSKVEYDRRFKVFRDNLKIIENLNRNEQGTGQYGVTKFSDLTPEEFSSSHGLNLNLKSENDIPFAEADIPDIDLPTEFDWRKKNAVTEVKDQGQCGSCWAFSTTGNVEGQYAIKNGKLLEFSEQELVDCDKLDEGCNGGLMDNAYRMIEKMGGLELEQDYPYEAENEKCHFDKTKVRVQLSGALNISHDETSMAKWLVANGPISIAINANAMQFYVGGVSHPWKYLCNPKSLDHGVLIVGYGVHKYPLFNKTMPYWLVKNSWGKSWGEQGYYRVYRGDGTCGLNQTPSSAIVA